MTKFYIEHKHKHVSLSDMTFSDYINVDYHQANEIFETWAEVNHINLTGQNWDEEKFKFIQLLANRDYNA